MKGCCGKRSSLAVFHHILLHFLRKRINTGENGQPLEHRKISIQMNLKKTCLQTSQPGQPLFQKRQAAARKEVSVKISTRAAASMTRAQMYPWVRPLWPKAKPSASISEERESRPAQPRPFQPLASDTASIGVEREKLARPCPVRPTASITASMRVERENLVRAHQTGGTIPTTISP